MKYLLSISILFTLACSSPRYTPQEVESNLIGTWTMSTDSMAKTFRFVRADSFTKWNRGYTFHEDGSMIYYGPWGCQMPPSFREFPATWEVDKKGRVVINVFSFVSTTAHFKIVSLTPNELRYTSDVVL